MTQRGLPCTYTLHGEAGFEQRCVILGNVNTNSPLLVDKVVTQSSDKEFHCLSITIFYRGK